MLRLAINLFDWPFKSTAQSDESVLSSFFLTLSAKSSDNEETSERKLDDEKRIMKDFFKFKYKRGQTLQPSVFVEIRHLDS